jgi:hypothetical protein
MCNRFGVVIGAGSTQFSNSRVRYFVSWRPGAGRAAQITSKSKYLHEITS